MASFSQNLGWFGAREAALVAVADGDVAVSVGSSGCKRGGWGRGWGAVGSSGSECHRSEGPGGGSGAEGPVVVVVLDDVVVIDGGCAAVVTDGMATLGELVGLVTKALGSSVVWVVASIVFVVAFVLKLMQSAVCMVWEAVSVVVGGVGIVWMSMLVVVTPSVWVSASSIKTAPQKSALAWATIERQSPAPCPSVSHFFHSLSFPCCVPSSCP